MRYSDPPLAGDSVNSIADARESAEEFSRKMSRPLLPKWNDVSDEPCLCTASHIEPELISDHKVPFGAVLHLVQCPLCCKVWKVKVAE